MSAAPPTLTAIVGVLLGLGLGTLAFRMGSAAFEGRAGLPRQLGAALEWLPAAALAAMVALAFMPKGELASDSLDLGPLAAALVSGLVGHRTRNLLLGVGAGLLAYWLFRAWVV